MIKISKKRKRFNLIAGQREISEMLDNLPADDECCKFISHGGFSSACFIMFISEFAKINHLYISTFHVGKKEAQMLNNLHNKGKLDNVTFVLFDMMKDTNKKYGYFEILKKICTENGWEIQNLKNHSKVLLFDTDKGKFVIETSSNLNENPKIEQFSFEKDEELFDFYKKQLFEMGDAP